MKKHQTLIFPEDKELSRAARILLQSRLDAPFMFPCNKFSNITKIIVAVFLEEAETIAALLIQIKDTAFFLCKNSKVVAHLLKVITTDKLQPK